MSYALLSDDLMLRLEASGVSRDARLLHIEGIVYCSTVLSDGDIGIRLARISDTPDADAAVAELVAAELWEAMPGGFYRIVGYLADQRSRERVLRDRAASRKRKADYDERGRRHAAGDHTICTKTCPKRGSGNDVTNSVPNGVSNPAQSNPIQSEGKGLDWERSNAPDSALRPAADRPHSDTAHDCQGGWIGDDDEGRPIPCPKCRPHLTPGGER